MQAVSVDGAGSPHTRHPSPDGATGQRSISDPFLIHFWSISDPFLIHFWSISYPFLIHFWSISGLFLIHFWSISDPFLIHFWSISDPFLIHFWSISDPFLIHFWSISDPVLNHFWSISDPFLIYFWSISDSFLIHFWSISDICFYFFIWREALTCLHIPGHRKIRLKESNAKCLKKWPVKGLCGRCFICLRPPPLRWPHTPSLPIHNVYLYTVHLFTQGRGGELTREKVSGAIVHKAGRKYLHNWLYLQSINSIKHQ